MVIINRYILLLFVLLTNSINGQCLTSADKIEIIHFKNSDEYNLRDRFPALWSILYEFGDSYLDLDAEDFNINYFIFNDIKNATGNALVKVEPKDTIYFSKYNEFGNRQNNRYVGFGESLIKKYYTENKDKNTSIIRPELLFIMYHELGHLYQKEFLEKIQIPNTSPEILELNSDFIAGLYVGYELIDVELKNEQFFYNYKINTNEIKKYISASKNQFDAMRNFRIIENKISQYINSLGDLNFYVNNHHHGTGAERIHAFVSGMKIALSNPTDTNLYNYIKTDLKNRINLHNKIKKQWKKLAY